MKTFTPAILVAILTFSGMLRAAEVILVADDFSTDKKERIEGLSLNGLPSQKGRATWKVPIGDNTVLTGKGNVSNAEPSQERAVEGLVAIKDPADPLTVQADVTTESAGWVSVGILSSDKIPWFDGRCLLFALIEPKGRWVLFKNEDNKQVEIAAGDLDEYSPNQPATLALKYDPADATAQVLVNAKNVSGTVETGIDTTAEIGAAGFYIYTLDTSIPGEATVDNFKVSVEKP